jgi:hypothetical protein
VSRYAVKPGSDLLLDRDDYSLGGAVILFHAAPVLSLPFVEKEPAIPGTLDGMNFASRSMIMLRP